METILIDRLATARQWAEAPALIEVGAHLVSDRDGYAHHGIYAGDGLVIHYGGFHRSASRRPVEYVTLRRFAAGGGLRVQDQPAAIYRGFEAVERAKSRLGEDRYRLLTNNCEHFCTWCVTGVGRSEQVRHCLTHPLAGIGTLFALACGKCGKCGFDDRRRLQGRRRGGWRTFVTVHASALR